MKLAVDGNKELGGMKFCQQTDATAARRYYI
jgi:hypothetical protein